MLISIAHRTFSQQQNKASWGMLSLVVTVFKKNLKTAGLHADDGFRRTQEKHLLELVPAYTDHIGCFTFPAKQPDTTCEDMWWFYNARIFFAHKMTCMHFNVVYLFAGETRWGILVLCLVDCLARKKWGSWWWGLMLLARPPFYTSSNWEK